MARAILDAYADAIGWTMLWSVDHPAHIIGGMVVAILALTVYTHKEDLA